jgi:Carboxypeptidase regulatory-like domain
MKTKQAALVTGVLLIGLGITLSAVAQEDEQYAAVAFVVLRDYNGKPVKNASVIMHPVKKNGKQKNSGLQLKTNTEGKTNFDGVPYGPLRVQVLAQGFQTFGEDYEVDKPEMEITIKLKRPQGQYSIYDDHPGANKEEKKKEKKDEPKPEQTPDQKPPEQKPQ